MARRWIGVVLCAAAGLGLFQCFGNGSHGYIETNSLFYWWGFQWVNAPSETQHGIPVLVISAWLFWRNLRIADCGSRIADWADPQSPIRDPQFAALAAMLVGLGLHALGFAAQQARISIVALLLFTWGVLRLAGGRRWSEAAEFPLGFLAFAIPINALDAVAFELRLGVTHTSAWLARAVGIGVLQNGTQLLAPDGRYQYDVVAACSGIRSLVALLALSLLLGYISFRGWARRALMLVVAVPFVFVGNVVRIGAIILAAQLGGQHAGDVAHEWMGWVVFAIVLGGVFGVARLLEKKWPERRSALSPTRLPGKPNQRVRDNALHLGTVAALVTTVAIGEMFFLHHLATLPPRGGAGVALAADGVNPVELPAFIGTEWIGRRAEVTPIEREILPPDTGFSRKVYVALANPKQAVFASIVLSGRDRTSIHRPELCLVGQGWTITAREATTIAGFPATLLHVRRELATPRGPVVVPQLMAYWFVDADRVVGSHAVMFAVDAWNRVAHARADRWAYVLLQTDADDGDAAALGRMRAIVEATAPVWQKVARAR